MPEVLDAIDQSPQHISPEECLVARLRRKRDDAVEVSRKTLGDGHQGEPTWPRQSEACKRLRHSMN
jgi:hypothetical protein